MILFFIYMLASQDVVYRIMVISKFSKHEIVIRTILQNFYPFALRIGFSEIVILYIHLVLFSVRVINVY